MVVSGNTWDMAEHLAKICISADPAAVAWIDEQIKNRTYRNRSHAFDVAVHSLMETLEKDDSSPKEAAIEVAA